MYVIGIDPGPIAGVVRIQLEQQGNVGGLGGVQLVDVQALQVTPDILTCILEALTRDDRAALALERFVVGPRSGRSSTPSAGLTTRNLVGQIEWWAREGYTEAFIQRPELHARSAAEVKPWATDERLDAAGLLELTKGMRHARDAARHALYCAVRDYGLPDPLSKAAGR
jgi:hypothetical protein